MGASRADDGAAEPRRGGCHRQHDLCCGGIPRTDTSQLSRKVGVLCVCVHRV